jgi:hypothetical protein
MMETISEHFPQYTFSNMLACADFGILSHLSRASGDKNTTRLPPKYFSKQYPYINSALYTGFLNQWIENDLAGLINPYRLYFKTVQSYKHCRRNFKALAQKFNLANIELTFFYLEIPLSLHVPGISPPNLI